MGNEVRCGAGQTLHITRQTARERHTVGPNSCCVENLVCSNRTVVQFPDAVHVLVRLNKVNCCSVLPSGRRHYGHLLRPKGTLAGEISTNRTPERGVVSVTRHAVALHSRPGMSEEVEASIAHTTSDDHYIKAARVNAAQRISADVCVGVDAPGQPDRIALNIPPA